MKHTDDFANKSMKIESDYLYTKAGTCITKRWRKMGWIPASEDAAVLAKWAHYQNLSSRAIEEIAAN
jgi:hypothetical protein